MGLTESKEEKAKREAREALTKKEIEREKEREIYKTELLKHVGCNACFDESKRRIPDKEFTQHLWQFDYTRRDLINTDPRIGDYIMMLPNFMFMYNKFQPPLLNVIYEYISNFNDGPIKLKDSVLYAKVIRTTPGYLYVAPVIRQNILNKKELVLDMEKYTTPQIIQFMHNPNEQTLILKVTRQFYTIHPDERGREGLWGLSLVAWVNACYERNKELFSEWEKLSFPI